jgi:hypothetical protein
VTANEVTRKWNWIKKIGWEENVKKEEEDLLETRRKQKGHVYETKLLEFLLVQVSLLCKELH